MEVALSKELTQSGGNFAGGLPPRFLRLWKRLAAPISRLFMANEVKVPELEKILRESAVHVAMNDALFAAADRPDEFRLTQARAALLTGLRRKDIADILGTSERAMPEAIGKLHSLINILAAWRTEAAFLDDRGKPRELPLRGKAPSLSQLCRRYGRGATERAIADLLVERGNAEWCDEGSDRRQNKRLRFRNSLVVSHAASTEALYLLAQYGSDFFYSLKDRLDAGNSPGPRFRQAYFRDIDPERVNEAREALHAEMEMANRRYAACLEEYRVAPGDQGVRLGAGTYSFCHSPVIE